MPHRRRALEVGTAILILDRALCRAVMLSGEALIARLPGDAQPPK